jgi:HNH endonuclease
VAWKGQKYKRMSRIPIPDSQPMGRLGKRRDDRARWHILRDGAPVCGRRDPALITHTAFYAQVKSELICKHCHHEFSWRAMPHDVEFQDRGFATPCLIWKLGVDGHGYGKRGRKNVRTFTHREAYEQVHGAGSIPRGYVIHHRCHVPECLNTDHLVAMSRADHVIEHQRTFDYAEAARLYEVGWGPTEIGQALGVSRRAVKAAFERMSKRGEMVMRPRGRS